MGLFLFTTTFWPFRSSSDTSRCQFTKYKQSSIGSKALIYFQYIKVGDCNSTDNASSRGSCSDNALLYSCQPDSYDLILRLATFGQDIAWKHEIIRAVTDRSQILEFACGTGILSSMLAERGKSVTGIDLTFEYLLTLKRS